MLFDTFLQHEGALPERCGYDKPSTKFLKFLEKYYQLSGYVAQLNNFVVFNRYFEVAPESANMRLQGLSRRPTCPSNRGLNIPKDNVSRDEDPFRWRPGKQHVKVPD